MLHVSASPHVRDGRSTSAIMADVAIALMPACGYGIYLFGWRALLVLAISVATCVLTELVYEWLMKKPITIGDFSAVVTGLVLGVNLPASAPWYLPFLGGIFAILVVKLLFGGLGQNFMNPALAARCFLMISFAAQMTAFPDVDMASGATPLTVLKQGGEVNVLQMFLGQHSGTIGETCVIAILIGFIYLLIRRVISARIPLVYVGSTLVFLLFWNAVSGTFETITTTYLLAQLCGGGLLLGAVFMATDYTTSPITKGGQWIYALLLGFLTALFRVCGSTSEGVSYAIILGNLVVPLIERVTIPRAFGKGGKKGGAAV